MPLDYFSCEIIEKGKQVYSCMIVTLSMAFLILLTAESVAPFRIAQNTLILERITFSLCYAKPGFHIIAPAATISAVVEKRVLHKNIFMSAASDDTAFSYDRQCRSILDSKMQANANEQLRSYATASNRRYGCPYCNTAQEKTERTVGLWLTYC